MFRMTTEAKAAGYVAEWLKAHEGHAYFIFNGPYSIVLDCHDCGVACTETMRLMNEAYAEARGVLSRDGAAVVR